MDHRKNQRGSKKYLKENENENTTIQTLWDRAKEVLRGNSITIPSYPKKQKKKKKNSK